MSDRNAGGSSGPTDKKKKPSPAPAHKKKGGHRGADVGRALRSVYDETLREDVPDDFRDLLGKLS